MRQRVRTTELSPLFRSASQAEILALLFTGGREVTVREIASAIGRDRSQTSRDVGKLVRAGLLSVRAAGRVQLVTTNSASPLHDAVEKIVLHSYGPRHVLQDALEHVHGVDKAWIFGSWAARYHGEAGVPPGDIDVLIIGDADADDVWDACAEAGRRLGREVNARITSAKRWNAGTDPFLAGIKDRPLVQLDLARADA